MRKRNYLNAIMTVNAVLLGGLLWTQVAATPLFASRATAQSRSKLSGNPVPTVPNAAKARNLTNQLLRELRSTLDTTNRLLQSGNVKIEVTNLDEVDINLD
jgi:hypothetical protein